MAVLGGAVGPPDSDPASAVRQTRPPLPNVMVVLGTGALVGSSRLNECRRRRMQIGT